MNDEDYDEDKDYKKEHGVDHKSHKTMDDEQQ
jgi:hypothetical protein